MADLLTSVLQTEERLAEQGVESQERVAFCCSNSGRLMVAILACWRRRAIVVPLSTRYPMPQLRQAFQEMGCVRTIVSQEHRQKVPLDDAIALETLVSLNTTRCGDLLWDQLELDPSQSASLVLTSGSTARPKGVLHTLASHYYSALGADGNIPFRRGDTWLVSLPLYHVSGLSLITRALLHGGMLLFPADRSMSLAQCLAAGEITHLSLVPLQLDRLLEDTNACRVLPRLEAILVGGSACPRSTIKRCAELELPLFLTYGSSEMASQVTTTVPHAAVKNPASSGRLLAHRELKIADDGEILLKGETCFQGYVHAKQLERPFDEEGWFASGDLGYLNPMGELIVTGRKDTRFTSGGEEIYPEEIEREIQAIEGVERCVVVAVPSGQYGKRPVAFVTMQEGRALERTDFRSELLLIERYKIPDAFFPMPDDQRGRMKVDRSALARRARELMKG